MDIHGACAAGAVHDLKALLRCGADVNRITGQTPRSALHVACCSGHAACVRLLLEAGADVHCRTYHGSTAMDFACSGGFDACVRLLIQHGAEINKRNVFGRTPLFASCMGGNAECAKLLLENGADIHARDMTGSAVYDTSARCSCDCRVLLLEYGAPIVSLRLHPGRDWTLAACAIGANQFVRAVEFSTLPSESLRAIMWRSPSLRVIGTFCDSGLALRTGDLRTRVLVGDTVRICDTIGDWQVAEMDGDKVFLCGRKESVSVSDIVLAGPARLAWHEVYAAEARGQSGDLIELLAQSGFISVKVRSLVGDFLATRRVGHLTSL